MFAWRRLVDPATAAPYASYLSYLQVENAQDIIDGKKKPAELGVEAKMITPLWFMQPILCLTQSV